MNFGYSRIEGKYVFNNKFYVFNIFYKYFYELNIIKFNGISIGRYDKLLIDMFYFFLIKE